MKVALFILCLSLSLNVVAQTPSDDPVNDLIEKFDADTAKEQEAAKAKVAAQAKAARLAKLEAAKKAAAADDQRARENAAKFALPDLTTEIQHEVQSSQKPPCPPTTSTPAYTSIPYNEAEQDFYEQGFVGPQENGHFTMPQISSINLSRIAPNATHEMNLTVAIEAGAGWSTKAVEDTLAKTAKIYAQCGIRINRATVVSSRLPYATNIVTEPTEKMITAAMPKGAAKPWLFFVDHRSDNPSQDGGGTSFAYIKDTGGPDIRGSAWIARDSLVTGGKANVFTKSPELVVGHELAHLLTDGDHQNTGPNILNGDGHQINAAITPLECQQMKANSALVHPL